MRTGLSGLTNRGRSFLAAGITAVVCAVLLGQPALTRVGILLAVLPLVAALVIGRTRYQLALNREVTPHLVAAGQPTTVHLALTNEGKRRTGLLLLEEQLPYALGSRPRFVVDGIGPGWHRAVSHQIRADVRGRYEIGPMTVRVTDPFGLVELQRAFHGTEPLIVTPRVVSLPATGLGGTWTGSGDNRPRAFASGSAEDVTVREYHRGDDLRRVHWRSSARRGELMVRREEQPWQSRATVLLDNRERAHHGTGAASSLETAVVWAASIAAHLTGLGFQVRLVTADGEDPNTLWHDRSATQNTAPLLEALAVLQQTKRNHLATDWLTESLHGSLLIGVLGDLDQHDHAALRRMKVHGSRPLAVALDVDQWRTGAAAGTNARWLSGLGWSAVAAGPSDRLPTLWHELGKRALSPIGEVSS